MNELMIVGSVLLALFMDPACTTMQFLEQFSSLVTSTSHPRSSRMHTHATKPQPTPTPVQPVLEF